MSDQPLKSTFKDEREMESSLFPITDISRASFGNCHRLARESTGLPDCSFKRSAQVYTDFSDRSSLGSMF